MMARRPIVVKEYYGSDMDGNRGEWRMDYYCPRKKCGEDLWNEAEMEYFDVCPTCGQEIDWEELE